MIIIKKIIMLILFLLPISISSFYYKTTFFNIAKNCKIKTIIVHVVDKNLYLDLEDYIVGVVSGEMPALFTDEALKAQAVASRSYLLSKSNNQLMEISSSINDQVYLTNYELKEKWRDKYNEYYIKINNLVLLTKNEVLKKSNKIIKTYYFSMSNGYTEDSISVFSDNSISGVKSEYDNETLTNFIVTKTYTAESIKQALNIQNITIGNIVRNNTNHVTSIEINGHNYTGIEFRKLLNLRSTDFTIDEQESNYIITTKGYGHDVGMSQYGANEMAKHGFSYRDILLHYYQNAKLIKI